MTGSEVHQILHMHGVGGLHHANTLTTSCTFLQLGGLASRGFVEDRRLPQTPQYSDSGDKKLGVWYDIFMDGVDLHARGGIRNNYGPVLFILPINILLNLPPNTDVFVTKKNPVHWKITDAPSDRYFLSQQELQAGYQYGEFGQHIILRTTGGFLPFSNPPVRVKMDDPQKVLTGGDAYNCAVQKLQNAAGCGNVPIIIEKRQCRLGCRCISGHSLSYQTADLRQWF